MLVWRCPDSVSENGPAPQAPHVALTLRPRPTYRACTRLDVLPWPGHPVWTGSD